MTAKTESRWKKLFALIYTGQAFSIIGSSAVQFAIIWWLTIKTQSAVTLTIASIVGFLPQGIIGPIAGVWVDRYSRKLVMILADGFIALSSAVLAIIFLFGDPPYYVIYIMLFARALGGTFHSPALQAAIPMLVPQEHLVKAGGWGQAVVSGSNMLGPVLGAFMMSVATIPLIMLLDIGGALFAIITLTFVSMPRIKTDKEKLYFKDDIKLGIRAIKNNRPLIAVSLPILVVCVLYMPLGSLLPLLVNVHFGGNEWHTGISQFLFSAGFVAASAFMGFFGRAEKQFRTISIALVVLGITITLGGALPGSMFIVFLVLIFIFGCAGTFYMVPYMAYIQRSLDPIVLGKVMSLLMSIMSLASPFGLAFAGPIAERIGINVWYFVSGILVTAAGIWSFITTRRYDKKDNI